MCKKQTTESREFSRRDITNVVKKIKAMTANNFIIVAKAARALTKTPVSKRIDRYFVNLNPKKSEKYHRISINLIETANLGIDEFNFFKMISEGQVIKGRAVFLQAA